MQTNYGEIIAAAQDFMDTQNRHMRTYHGGSYLVSCDNSKLCESYRWMDRAQRALTVLCYVLNIPDNIPIQAARIINKAYERAYSKGRDPSVIDEERVLKALLANQ